MKLTSVSRKSIIFFVFLFLLSFTFSNSIDAAENTKKVQIQQKVNMSWLDKDSEKTIESLACGVQIPVNSKLKITAQMKNKGWDITTVVQFKNKEGFDYYDYYDGVLKIEGKNASKNQYHQLIDDGLSIKLTTSYKKIELEVKSIGSSDDEAVLDINYSYTSSKKEKTVTKSETFCGQFVSTGATYDGTLISKEKVTSGNSLKLPEVKRTGYSLLGFSSDPYGENGYYKNESVSRSLTLYAVYEKQQFSVFFYVNNEIYKEVMIDYGEDVKQIEAPTLTGMKFEGWDGDFKNVTENRNITVKYSKVEAHSSTSISFKEIETKNGSNKNDTEKTKIISRSSMGKTSADDGIEIKNKKEDGLNYLGIWAAGAIIAVVMYWLYRKRNKRKREPI